MPDWLDYERLAAAIYSDLAKNARVTHNDMIRGVDSGIDRQIDVSIRASVAGHDILIIVQAKDLAQPADVNVVGTFHSVIKDCRASKGVLICSGGFTSTAMEYGNKVNIDLCSVHDAQHRKWGVELRIPLLWVETTGDVALEMTLCPDATNASPVLSGLDGGLWVTSVDGGLTTFAVRELIATAWNANAASPTTGMSQKLVLTRPGMKLQMGDSSWCPVGSLVCICTARRLGWLGTFSFADCRGILNRATGTLRARVILTDRDFPMRRDENWSPVADPDALWGQASDMVRIDRVVGPEHFQVFVDSSEWS